MTALEYEPQPMPRPRPLTCVTTPRRPVVDPTSAGALRSVTTALDVLECFVADAELGVSDIARRLGVAKSTAHRLLTALCSRGFCEKNPATGQYRLGLHLYELGRLTQARMQLTQSALPTLEELRRLTSHTVHLALPDGADVVHAERLEGTDGAAVMGSMGVRFLSHCTASGRAIAAYNGDFAQARRDAGFPLGTRATIRNSNHWDQALRETRRSGVAVEHGEVVAGMSSVAAPICNVQGTAYAAVSIAAPTAVMYSQGGRMSRLVLAAARRLSRLSA